MSREVLKKSQTIILIIAMVIGLCVMTGTYDTYAAGSKSYKLPEKVTVVNYYRDGSKHKSSYKIKYDKFGNVTYLGGTKYKIKYQNNKGKIGRVTIDDGCTTIKQYNSKGKASSAYCYEGDSWMEKSFRYSKHGHICKIIGEDEYGSWTNKISIKYKSGRISSVYQKDEYVKKSNYNSSGLLTYAEFNKNYWYGAPKSVKFKYTRKNGKIVKSVAVYKGGDTKKSVTTYTYGKAKTKKKSTYMTVMGATYGFENALIEVFGDNSLSGAAFQFLVTI